jgi:hypothetical protein
MGVSNYTKSWFANDVERSISRKGEFAAVREPLNGEIVLQGVPGRRRSDLSHVASIQTARSHTLDINYWQRTGWNEAVYQRPKRILTVFDHSPGDSPAIRADLKAEIRSADPGTALCVVMNSTVDPILYSAMDQPIGAGTVLRSRRSTTNKRSLPPARRVRGE